jgi:hypothetical protein
MAFWRSKQRGPPEMVRALKDSIGKLDAGHSGSDTTRRVGAVYHVLHLSCCLLMMLPMLPALSCDSTLTHYRVFTTYTYEHSHVMATTRLRKIYPRP